MTPCLDESCGGLIQAASPITDPATRRSTTIRRASIDAHIPLDRRSRQARRADPRAAGSLQRAVLLPVAGRRTGTTSPSRCPGPTTELMAQYAKKYQMAMVVPVYEREQAGVYYNTAAVYDADGTYLGQVPQEPYPAHVRLLGEVLLQTGQPRLSRLQDTLRDDRRLHLLRPALPGRRAAPRPERRRDCLQSVGDGRRPLAVSLEARTARACGRQRLLHGAAAIASAPRRPGTSAGSTARRTSSTRAATSSRRDPKTRPSSSSPRWIWT